jgi:hypothetical protein
MDFFTAKNGPTFNWKYGVGFALGVLVTLIIIIVLANKFGKAPGEQSAAVPGPPPPPAPPADSNLGLSLPPTDATPPPPDGAEAYEPAPF